MVLMICDENGEVLTVGEALECVLDAVCMDDPDHAKAGKPHVSKDRKVLVLAQLIEDDEVRANQQEYVSGV